MSFNVTNKHIEDWFYENRWWADYLNIEEKIRLCKLFYIYQVFYQNEHPEINIQTRDVRKKLVDKLAELLNISFYKDFITVDSRSIRPTDKLLQPFYSKYQDIEKIIKNKNIQILQINEDLYKEIQVSQYEKEIEILLEETDTFFKDKMYGYRPDSTRSEKIKNHLSILYGLCVAKLNKNGCNDHFIKLVLLKTNFFGTKSFDKTKCENLIASIKDSSTVKKYEHEIIKQMVYDNMFHFFCEKNYQKEIPLLLQIYYDIVHNAECLYYGGILNAFHKFFVVNTNNREEKNPYKSTNYWEKIKKKKDYQTNLIDFYDILKNNYETIFKTQHFTYSSSTKNNKIIIDIKENPNSLLIKKNKNQFVTGLQDYIQVEKGNVYGYKKRDTSQLEYFYEYLRSDVEYGTKFTYHSDRIRSHGVFLDKNIINDSFNSERTGLDTISFSKFKDYLLKNDSNFILENENNVSFDKGNEMRKVVNSIKNWKKMNEYQGMDGGQSQEIIYDGAPDPNLTLPKSIKNVIHVFNEILISNKDEENKFGKIKEVAENYGNIVDITENTNYDENDAVKCVLLAAGLILTEATLNKANEAKITINNTERQIKKDMVFNIIGSTEYTYKLYNTSETDIPKTISFLTSIIEIRSNSDDTNPLHFNRKKIYDKWDNNDMKYFEKLLLVVASIIYFKENFYYSFNRVWDKYKYHIGIALFIVFFILFTNNSGEPHKYDLFHDVEELEKEPHGLLLEYKSRETEEIKKLDLLKQYTDGIGTCYKLLKINDHKLIELGFSYYVLDSKEESKEDFAKANKVFTEYNNISPISREIFPENILESDINYCITLANSNFEKICSEYSCVIKSDVMNFSKKQLEDLHNAFIKDLRKRELLTKIRHQRIIKHLKPTITSSTITSEKSIEDIKKLDIVPLSDKTIINFIDTIKEDPSRYWITNVAIKTIGYINYPAAQLYNFITSFLKKNDNSLFPSTFDSSSEFLKFKNTFFSDDDDTYRIDEKQCDMLSNKIQKNRDYKMEGLKNINAAIEKYSIWFKPTEVMKSIRDINLDFVSFVYNFFPKPSFSEPSKFFLTKYYPEEKITSDGGKKQHEKKSRNHKKRRSHHEKEDGKKSRKKHHKKSIHRKKSRKDSGKKSRKEKKKSKHEKRKSRR